MSRSSLQVVALVAGVLVLAPWAPLAARPAAGASPAPPPGILASLWGSLVNLWSAAGCEIDPNGKCVNNHGSAGVARAGRGIGSGRLVNARGAAGCEIDPDGRRCSQTPAGNGAGLAGVPISGGGAMAPQGQ